MFLGPVVEVARHGLSNPVDINIGYHIIDSERARDEEMLVFSFDTLIGN